VVRGEYEIRYFYRYFPFENINHPKGTPTMTTNQELFNVAYKRFIDQLTGTTEPDVLELGDYCDQMFEACNPLAYDPSDPPAVPTIATYSRMFNYGFSAITDEYGETFYFDENHEFTALENQFAYLIASPVAKSQHRSHPANQAAFSEMVKMLNHTAGNASDELALYVIGVMEDALSPHNPAPAVLSDAYREILAESLAAYKEDGAAEAVCDRLETLLAQRSATRLIVDAQGVARPDAGKWS
jgi:hypothetical protein